MNERKLKLIEHAKEVLTAHNVPYGMHNDSVITGPAHTLFIRCGNVSADFYATTGTWKINKQIGNLKRNYCMNGDATAFAIWVNEMIRKHNVQPNGFCMFTPRWKEKHGRVYCPICRTKGKKVPAMVYHSYVGKSVTGMRKFASCYNEACMKETADNVEHDKWVNQEDTSEAWYSISNSYCV